jgi:2-polyprenyl-6-methoxyphenol hydroxylase-like FAD-dependent oxidoreductase
MGEGHTYGFGALNVERSEDPLEARLERFRRRFAEYAWPVLAYLGALENDQQLHFGPIEWVEVDGWHRGRVVLIGDAAHAGPPHIGEGGCMAMEDSFVLAEELRTAKTVEIALDSYARSRMPRVDWVQA